VVDLGAVSLTDERLWVTLLDLSDALNPDEWVLNGAQMVAVLGYVAGRVPPRFSRDLDVLANLALSPTSLSRCASQIARLGFTPQPVAHRPQRTPHLPDMRLLLIGRQTGGRPILLVPASSEQPVAECGAPAVADQEAVSRARRIRAGPSGAARSPHMGCSPSAAEAIDGICASPQLRLVDFKPTTSGRGDADLRAGPLIPATHRDDRTSGRARSTPADPSALRCQASM
jgi:hypothetical protein